MLQHHGLNPNLHAHSPDSEKCQSAVEWRGETKSNSHSPSQILDREFITGAIDLQVQSILGWRIDWVVSSKILIVHQNLQPIYQLCIILGWLGLTQAVSLAKPVLESRLSNGIKHFIIGDAAYDNEWQSKWIAETVTNSGGRDLMWKLQKFFKTKLINILGGQRKYNTLTPNIQSLEKCIKNKKYYHFITVTAEK